MNDSLSLLILFLLQYRVIKKTKIMIIIAVKILYLEVTVYYYKIVS